MEKFVDNFALGNFGRILLRNELFFFCIIQDNWNRKNELLWLFSVSHPAWMHLRYMDVSYSVLETSQRGLIFKSLRRLPADWLKTFPQRRLWDLLGFFKDVFELHLRLTLGFQTKAFFGYLFICIQIFKYFAKLI